MEFSMPSPQANTFALTEFLGDPVGAAEFSDFADDIFLNNFTSIRGKQIRMLGGADIVRLFSTASGSGGKFDTDINGNLGVDTFFDPAGSRTRNLVRGGAEGDKIFAQDSADGGDWLAGGSGADQIFGGVTTTGFNVLRGNAGADVITGNRSNDVLLGDFGRDTLTAGFGKNIFLMRTDDHPTLGQNATSNSSECDLIRDYVGGFDRIVIPGITSFTDLIFDEVPNGGQFDVLISSEKINGLIGQRRFIARVETDTIANIKLQTANGRGIVIGEQADRLFNGLNTNDFLANADLPRVLLGLDVM